MKASALILLLRHYDATKLILLIIVAVVLILSLPIGVVLSIMSNTPERREELIERQRSEYFDNLEGSVTEADKFAIFSDDDVQWPARGTSDNGIRGFYAQRQIDGKIIQHNGVDISNSLGTPIYSMADGIVTLAGYWHWSCGNWCLFIEHEGGFVSFYAHMQGLAVETGDIVKKGQLVGAMGNEGNSFGSHLHFGIMHNGAFVDPRDIIKGEPPL